MINNSDIEKVIYNLSRKLKRAKLVHDSYIKEAEDLKTDLHKHYTFFGGVSIGYARGEISILEDLIDDLKDILEPQNEKSKNGCKHEGCLVCDGLDITPDGKICQEVEKCACELCKPF